MNTVEPIRDVNKITAVKKILRSESPRNWLLFTFGINSALRVSDLLKLRQADVYDNRSRPLIGMQLKEKKTGKCKTFKFNDNLRKGLDEYVRQVGYNPEAYLFPSRKGENKPIGRQHAWEIITSAAQAIGLTNIGTHTMRNYGTC